MKILVDIGHPAHVHFFRNAIDIWQAHDHEILVTARDKDLAHTLLDRYQIPYQSMGKARTGLTGIALELLYRCWRFWGITSRHKPNVMVGIGGPGYAHVGWIRRIPSLVFTDTENAHLSNSITFPFATRVCTPSCYEESVSPAKHIRYQGYHELAYLHPNYFTPDPAILANWGLNASDNFIIVRFVSWGALHDLTDHGFNNKINLIHHLQQFGQVLITSEGELPAELKPLQISVSPEQIHHLLYYARLLIGESATMASESAVLGTPAIFVSTSTRGYTNEQEAKYDMVYTFSDAQTAQQQALEKATEILSDPAAKERWQAKRAQLLNDKIDVTRFLVELVEEYGRNHRG